MKLPGLQDRPQRAERPSLATVSPTDLGLGAVAQEASAWEAERRRTRELEEEVQRDQDEQATQGDFDALTTQFESRFAEAGAAWDGVEPGFARRMTGELETAVAPVLNREGLTPGQRDALESRVNVYRRATAQRAISFEAQKRGGLETERRAAREATAIGTVMSQYAELFGAAKAARDQAYDGSTPDYAAGVLADHDVAAQQLIEQAPEALKPRLTETLEARRLQLQAQAMDFEGRAEQGFVANQARTAGERLTNSVLTAPSLYETSVADVDQIVAGLPAAARGEARAGLVNDLTEAYFDGLMRDGQQELALSQLNGGTFDDRLKPATKARLLDRATRRNDELSVDQWMARLQLQQTMEDNIASLAATGQPVAGADVGTVATLLGGREAAQYALALEQAEKAHEAVGAYSQMTVGQIREQVEALAPVPGAEGYAEAQQRYELASRAAEAEIKAREEDPAAWALRGAPSLQAQLTGLGTGDPAAARRNAGAYAAAVLQRQRAVGVPLAEQRILPEGVAKSIVEAATQNPEPADGIRSLAQVVEAFAPPPGADGQTVAAAMARQRMVSEQLKAAGADNGDLAAAIDLADDPVRLGRYVAAMRNRSLETLERREQRDVREAVDDQLGEYLRSFEGLPGSAAVTEGRRVMAARLAAEHMARNGGGVGEAAREAVEIITGPYRFVGPSGWRMPARVAERRDGDGQRHEVLAQRGAARIMSQLTAGDGAGFFAPDDGGRNMTEAQRRERYADAVALRGRWMTTPDDAGVVLMQPTVDGRWTPALDRSGAAIQRTWAQMVDAGRDRRSRGGARRTGNQPARGLRNNNPGNIEYREGTRWQGQTGSDGRFVTFATPEHGLRALARDLNTKSRRGLNTVSAILREYAPREENNTAAYIRSVSGRLGVQPDQRLDLNDPGLVASMMAAIIQIENGDQPYSPALLQEAARRGIAR